MANAPGALEEAMGHYAAGDDAAFGRVYDLASGPLFAFLVRLCRDRALAEDLTHEAFLRIHRARGLYRPGAAVLPWAYAIGRRLFLDSVRSRRREAHSLDEGWQGGGERERPSDPGVPAPDAGADEEVEARRLAERIERALGEMPETQATAFRLLKQQGLSVSEAAAVLGTTEMTVKLRAHRAYESLRKRLGDVLGREAGGAPTKSETS
ncbi:MAG TPA: RNA polymerase sigma factor [Polyangiaceae bacterium]|nr:RNA polymerase sigma factor [Polyangiaceae bacterium]